MSISNHSVDVKAPTSELVKQLEDYEASYAEADTDPSADEAYMEWLESGIELIEAELGRREDEDEDNELGQHYDSPSIQDTLGDRPSYAS